MSPEAKQRTLNVAPWVALMLTIMGFAGKFYADAAVTQSNVETIIRRLDKIEGKVDNLSSSFNQAKHAPTTP